MNKTFDRFLEPFFCFTGFSGGAYALVAPYYVSEIAETSMRGALASLMQLMATFGVLFVNALNIYETVNWVTISATCIAIPGEILIFKISKVINCKIPKNLGGYLSLLTF